MSLWNDHKIEDKVIEALEELTLVNEDGHHFGRPYMTAYQLAIKIDRAYPALAEELGMEVGGLGIGKRNSLAQYLANQLSRRIKSEGDGFRVEGAFLSNDDVEALRYVKRNGEELTSSLTNSGYDLSLFRRRTAPGDA
jgi:N-acetyl-beta-hexosaminidase